MSVLRAPPPILPRRRFLAAPAPRLASVAVERERRGVTLVMAGVVGALFMLFAWSYVQDLSAVTQAHGPAQRFSDTRF